MSHEPRPTAHCMTSILCARDFREATEYSTRKLFFDVLWEWDKPPTFGCVRLGNVEIFLCLQGQGHSGMWRSILSVGELLEETLVHTFESVHQGGVAGPHTKKTLSYIQALKQKHGIAYDTRASYRFVERFSRSTRRSE